MAFEEILPYLRARKRVRRVSWPEGSSIEHYDSRRFVIVQENGQDGTLERVIGYDDILATDWEIAR